jgi:bifunctional non-homologous end joining protein LigD
VPSHHLGEGRLLYDHAVANGLEGLIAKRVDSPYLVGKRSPAWRKVKIRRGQELVVGGWLPGEGNRTGTLGALLVGHHDDTGLRYAGRVGTGFNEAELRRLQRRLDDLAADASPFVDEAPAPVRKKAHWVRPEMVVQVEFGEWTVDGVLRHPSYLGERVDKDPRDVVREP